METAEKLFETDEQEFVDPVTGEIIETAPSEVSPETLPHIGRWIRSAERMLEHLGNGHPHCNCSDCNLIREANKMKELVKARADQLLRQRDSLLGLASQVVTTTGQKSVHYPGIGRFGFRESAVSVGTAGWDALTPEEQKEYRDHNMTFIRVKESLAPDKKRIKAAFEENQENDRLVGLFTLDKPGPTFHFKSE